MSNNFNLRTPNYKIGIFPTLSRLAFDNAIVSDVLLPYTANLLKVVGQAGWIVYRHAATKEKCLTYGNLGETIPALVDVIYATETVDGKTTTAQTVIYMTCNLENE